MEQSKKERVVKLTEDLAFAVQPTVEELKHLVSEGIKSVVNMREPWEKGFIKDEKEILEAQGVKYHLAPIDQANDFTKEYTDSLLKTIDEMPKPILVHCNTGLTACVASLLYVGKQMGADADQILAWGADMGHNFAFHAQLYSFIQSYCKK